MKVHRRLLRCNAAALGAVVVWALAGCQHRPPPDVTDAQAALAAAWAACGPEYAARRFDAARALVADVERLATSGHAHEARRASGEAINRAREAEQVARERMGAARAAADTAIEEAAEALAKARAARSGGPPGSGMARAEARLREAREAASVSHCNYLRARDLATEAKNLAKNDSRAVAFLLPDRLDGR